MLKEKRVVENERMFIKEQMSNEKVLKKSLKKRGLPKYCVEQSNAIHIAIKTNVTLMLNVY